MDKSSTPFFGSVDDPRLKEAKRRFVLASDELGGLLSQQNDYVTAAGVLEDAAKVIPNHTSLWNAASYYLSGGAAPVGRVKLSNLQTVRLALSFAAKSEGEISRVMGEIRGIAMTIASRGVGSIPVVPPIALTGGGPGALMRLVR